MEGRDGMSLQGSGPYYLHRGLPGPVGPGPGQPGFSSGRPSSNPSLSGQAVVRGSSNSNVGHGGFNMEANDNNVHGFSITVSSTGAGVGGGALSDPVKKKRGRPRKYVSDGPGVGVGVGLGSGLGTVALGLLPSSLNSGDRRKRGRPPGSGRKQRLASVGEWMNNSAGFAFTPHVLHVSPGEDIASKILSFSQQRPRAVCIMSGSGGVSAVTLRQPTSTGTVTFEGRFEILCLSGSYLVSETGSARDRVGGVNVSLSSADGRLIGGAVGRLIAAKPVLIVAICNEGQRKQPLYDFTEVVLCSFAYCNAKGKTNDDSKEKSPEQLLSDKALMHVNSSRSENVAVSRPGSRGVDQRNPSTDIDLTSG